VEVLLPPQPLTPTVTMSSNTASRAGSARRRLGSVKNSTNARTVPPPVGQKSGCPRLPEVAAVVLTVSVDVCAAEPVKLNEVGESVQVAGLVAAIGLMEQLKPTVPVNPLVGAIEMTAVLPDVAPRTTVIPDPASVKLGAALTDSATVVDAVNDPDVPLSVTVTGPPTVAELEAVKVTTCVPCTVPAVKLAVTPLGNPAAASATLPVNPPMLVTETVLVPVAPCAIDSVAGAATRVKLGG
jgi:hypothetical protein